MNRRLYRSVDDRVLAGVASGMADWLDLDPSIVRLVWVVAAIGTAGMAILVYIAMAIVIPEEPYTTPGGAPGSAAADAPTTPVPPEVPGVPSAAEGDPVAPPAGWAAAPQPGSGWQPGATGWREARRAERDARRATRRAGRLERREGGQGGGAILLGVLLILGGAYLLARDYLPALRLNLAWPVVLVAIGVLLVFRSIDLGGGGSSPSDSPPKP
jgi:phage shock protein C